MEQKLDILELLKQNQFRNNIFNVGDLFGIVTAIDFFQNFQGQISLNGALDLALIGFFGLGYATWSYMASLYYDGKKLNEKVLNSNEYKKWQELYYHFIDIWASYLKSLNFSSSVEALEFINMLLYSGFFSVTEKYQYHYYKNNPYESLEVLGSRIISGFGVCRHSSAFTSQLLNKIGYPACNLSCAVKHPNSCWQHKINFNHLIIGITDEENKFTYDTVSQEYLLYKKQNNRNMTVLETYDHYDYIINPDSFKWNFDQSSYQIFNNRNYRNLDEKKTFESQNLAKEKMILERQKLMEMKENNRMDMEEIVRLEKILAPHY